MNFVMRLILTVMIKFFLFMDYPKTFVFGGDSDKNTIDPNLLLAMNGGGFGGFGGNGSWIWALFLFALFGGNFGGFGGNGNRGVGFLSNQISEDTGRQLVMQAIQGNRDAITSLASSFNCSVGDIQTALCSIQGKISDVANQVGMSSQAVINAIDRGDSAIANQLASCCCDLKSAIASTNANLTKGFADVGYAFRDQTCNIEKAISSSTSAITARLDAMEKTSLLDKIDALREKNGTLTTQLNLEHQNQYTAGVVAQSIAPVNAAVAALQSDVDSIKCKLPRTETVVAQPQYIPVNYGVNLGLSPYGCSFGNTWNGSLWG